MTIIIPNDLSNGAPQDAAPVQANFDYIEATLNTIDGNVNTNTTNAARAGFHVTRNANQSATAATLVPVSWDVELDDSGGYIAAPSSTATVPAGKGGVYLAGATVLGASAWTTGSYVQIALGAWPVFRIASNGSSIISVTATAVLADADTITVSVFNNGTTQNFTGGFVCHRVAL